MKEQFCCYSIAGQIKVSIAKLLGISFSMDRRWQEIREAAIFGRLLEIWSGKKLQAAFVDEGKTKYKGVDFLLYDIQKPEKCEMFQLLEYANQKEAIINSDALANWIIKKKFEKGDSKVHLIVSIKHHEAEVDLKHISNSIGESPFRSVAIMGVVKEPNTFILIGVSIYKYRLKIDIGNFKTFYATNHCPFFMSED